MSAELLPQNFLFQNLYPPSLQICRDQDDLEHRRAGGGCSQDQQGLQEEQEVMAEERGHEPGERRLGRGQVRGAGRRELLRAAG